MHTFVQYTGAHEATVPVCVQVNLSHAQKGKKKLLVLCHLDIIIYTPYVSSLVHVHVHNVQCMYILASPKSTSHNIILDFSVTCPQASLPPMPARLVLL